MNFSFEPKQYGDIGEGGEDDEGEDVNEDVKKPWETPEQYHKRIMRKVTGKEIRAQIFLNDPCEATKIFFSSFLREKGYYE